MEIKAKIDKPYTEEQYTDFVVTYNHGLNYEIRETDTELQAWGYTEEEKQEQEKERVKHLKCTKRVFAMMLQELGFDWYNQILPVINANSNVKLQFEYCIELERSNPLIDQIAAQFSITSTQLDDLFKYANGEITLEEFRKST